MSEDNIVRYRPPPGGYRVTEEDRRRFQAMTDEERHAAALSDPDSPPLNEEQLAGMKRITLARSARWRSGMTQQAFAEAFGFTLGRLRDLEQGRTQPDGATESYLRLIREDAKAVIELLARAA
ncbi:helix-turn-helix domain-containing protein [Brevundimonas sp. GCM10030266]|uniref:helix-turn-helix domain-containing protein n=1 Tax=Brevundimonas sp. GCM10030266 TaxID=3273386 RepID=UPI0036209450